MRLPLILIIIFLSYQNSLSQDTNKREIRFPIWTFHENNVAIYGISVGAFSGYDSTQNTVSNGLRIEIPGVGALPGILMGNSSPLRDGDTITKGIKRKDFVFSEIINGINISTGSWGKMNYNGLTISLVAQHGYLTNGIAISGLINSTNKVNGISIGGVILNEALHHNGLQIGLLGNSSIIMFGVQIGVQNEAKTLEGLQVGLFNRTYKSKGLQLGLWNINEHRKLPLINWSF
tara:strand:+ start:203 stop:901 length:699 start_codon:yes stop_codon:yes gene_type:complete